MKHAIIALAITMAFGAGTAFAASEAMPRHEREAQKERIEAGYKSAKKQCDELPRSTKAACRKDAKAAYQHARGQAKVARSADENGARSGQSPGARLQAGNADATAEYLAAKDRCEALFSLARDNCMNEVRKRFKM